MAKSLRDFLELTEAAAAGQWVRILRRMPPDKGRRQEPFLPIEVLLCYGLFLVVDPHRYGGANIASVPAEMKALAAAFRRSPGSLLYKMLNLDSSAANCGKFEVELYVRLSDSPEVYPALHLTIMRAARAAGLSDREVPDFLGVLAQDWPFEMLGQDELGSREVDQALDEQAETAARLRERLGLRTEQTDKLVEQKVRIGQHRFARDVLHEFDHRCGFCGFAPGPLEGSRLLFASHIKPWRSSDDRERLDPRNGIAACPIHDAAFDGGLLTVNGGRKIHRAGELEALMVHEPEAELYFGGAAVKPHLILPTGARGPGTKYLAYHREHVFRAG